MRREVNAPLPSDDPVPSQADAEVTQAMVKAANFVGIRLDGHLIVGDRGYYFPFLLKKHEKI